MSTARDPVPTRIHLKRDAGLTITWSDGRVSVYPVDHLRRLSPSADQKELRQEMASNPLTVLPSSGNTGAPLRAEAVEKVGNYAIRIRFSDGHDTGIYSWGYLRHIDPNHPGPDAGPAEDPPGGDEPG